MNLMGWQILRNINWQLRRPGACAMLTVLLHNLCGTRDEGRSAARRHQCSGSHALDADELPEPRSPARRTNQHGIEPLAGRFVSGSLVRKKARAEFRKLADDIWAPAVGESIGRLLADATRTFEARCNALDARLNRLEQRPVSPPVAAKKKNGGAVVTEPPPVRTTRSHRS